MITTGGRPVVIASHARRGARPRAALPRHPAHIPPRMPAPTPRPGHGVRKIVCGPLARPGETAPVRGFPEFSGRAAPCGCARTAWRGKTFQPHPEAPNHIPKRLPPRPGWAQAVRMARACSGRGVLCASGSMPCQFNVCDWPVSRPSAIHRTPTTRILSTPDWVHSTGPRVGFENR